MKTLRLPLSSDILHALFPSVRAELLRRLFSDPTREFYVRELARLHGGDAWVEDAPGDGARFIIELNALMP